jgi:hypothetical protein
MSDAMEQGEHVAHAGHDEHDEHDPKHHEHHEHHPKNRLGIHIGITMATLGVLLAFAAAQVGGERTELVQTLVERSNAQQQYHAQDVKHRIAFLALQQMHAMGAQALDKKDMLSMATTVERYLDESGLAKDWSEAYDPKIEAHVTAQEHYDWSQLLAEIGVVVSSVALLIKRRLPWFLAMALGVASIGMIGVTWNHTRSVLAGAEDRIEKTQKAYFDARTRDKTTAAEDELVKSVKASAAGAVAE